MAGPVHTQFAMKALDLADLFKSIVGSENVMGTDGDGFTPELSAPDGPSTGGGKQSVQHLKLSRTALTVVVGSADQIERTVELRSFDYVSNLHAQRWKGQALPVERASYDAFLKRAREFFTMQGMQIVLKDAAPAPVAPPPTKGSGGLIAIAAAIFVVIVGAAYFFATRR